MPIIARLQKVQLWLLASTDEQHAALAFVRRQPAREVRIRMKRRRLIVLEVHLRFAGRNHGGIEALLGQGLLPLFAELRQVLLKAGVVEGGRQRVASFRIGRSCMIGGHANPSIAIWFAV